MHGLAQRSVGSKSVVNRSGLPYSSTLLSREHLGMSASRAQTRVGNTLTKSQSSNSLGQSNEKLQRSQVNIDRKMREDFDRLQNQLKKRHEKEAAAQE